MKTFIKYHFVALCHRSIIATCLLLSFSYYSAFCSQDLMLAMQPTPQRNPIHPMWSPSQEEGMQTSLRLSPHQEICGRMGRPGWSCTMSTKSQSVMLSVIRWGPRPPTGPTDSGCPAEIFSMECVNVVATTVRNLVKLNQLVKFGFKINLTFICLRVIRLVVT